MSSSRNYLIPKFVWLLEEWLILVVLFIVALYSLYLPLYQESLFIVKIDAASGPIFKFN